MEFNGFNSDLTIRSGGLETLQFLGATGDLTIYGDLTINSDPGAVTTRIKADGSVDLAGVENFFSTSGGRKWVYINTQSNNQSSAQSNPETNLTANVNYFVGTSGASSSDQLILLLPANPQTGDMIRFIDVSGNTSNLSQLIIRAAGEQIQGDSTGTTIGITTGVAFAGGELIINTPNASFGLVYNGETTAPPQAQGWWLMEI